MNIASEAATDEPASPPTLDPTLTAPSVSIRLTESLVEPAPAADPDSHTDPADRHNAWTPSRKRAFLETLAECGTVVDAARAAGMSVRGAYALRRSAAGRAFDDAWRAALLHARGRIEDELIARAIHGCREVIVRDGQVWGERHRFDNRLALAVLARLQGQAAATEGEDHITRFVAEKYDQFVETVCAGESEASPRGDGRFANRQFRQFHRPRCHRILRATDERDGPMATVSFATFTAPETPPDPQSDGPLDTITFITFVPTATPEARPLRPEADDPLATDNFVNFTSAVTPESRLHRPEADGPMASVKFDKFTPTPRRKRACSCPKTTARWQPTTSSISPPATPPISARLT